MGPPIDPPPMLWMYLALRWNAGWKNGRDPQALFIWYQKAEPWIRLVPLLMWTFTARPPANPCAGSMLPVTTLTCSIDSSPGTYPTTYGSHTLLALAPSMRMLFMLRGVPL